MNKIRFLFFLFLVALISFEACKKEDLSSKWLLKKKIYEDGSVSLYRYNMYSQLLLQQYIEDPDSINNNYWAYNYDDSFIQSGFYYKDGKLTSRLFYKSHKYASFNRSVLPEILVENNLTRELSYNNDKLVEINSYPNKWVFEYSGDNVIKVTILVAYQNIYSINYIKEYEYDDKINPYYNIIAMKFRGNVLAMSRNNIVKIINKKSNGDIYGKYSYNYSYEYSEDDYPIKETVVNFDNTYREINSFEYILNKF